MEDSGTDLTPLPIQLTNMESLGARLQGLLPASLLQRLIDASRIEIKCIHNNSYKYKA